MDLNEKLAQRRKEREIEAAAIQKEIVAQETEKIKVIENLARKRLAEKGYPITQDNASEEAIKKQAENIENRMATDRMTDLENFIYVSLIFVGIISFFISPIYGFLFLVGAFWYLHHYIDKYKKLIIAEEISRRTMGNFN